MGGEGWGEGGLTVLDVDGDIERGGYWLGGLEAAVCGEVVRRGGTGSAVAYSMGRRRSRLGVRIRGGKQSRLLVPALVSI